MARGNAVLERRFSQWADTPVVIKTYPDYGKVGIGVQFFGTTTVSIEKPPLAIDQQDIIAAKKAAEDHARRPA
jgi:hypothetical protein